ncbi:uncharacterized protein N7458_004191 [Penicillium daleae]|uniref:F-box domain-containing protein n=1 Tax=Penicillium daleae TaxID=63821 RepID=A0AAD6CC30_9EURO|nr:uncharacterized protein N7458_004191 [Penicillium daleae]KAJ5455927.1 hypothetical protein N7458_004191 [Penicillium daleae]
MTPALIASPTEILREIFVHIDQADLLALSRTHRSLRPAIEPLLYSCVKFTWSKSHNPAVPQFLRTIIRRPELAAYVKELILDGKDFDADMWAYKHQSPKLAVKEIDLQLLIECATGFNVSYRDEWIQELQSGTMDAFVALLLSQLSTLTSLYLGENFCRESRCVGHILRSSLCEKSDSFHSFQHLRDVSTLYPSIGLDQRRYRTARNTADVLPLFYLPTVEQIRVFIDNPVIFEWPAVFTPSAQSLLSLDLTMIREGNLGKLLSVTPKLESLKWDWYYRPDLRDDSVTDIINLDQLAADLALVRENLTSLSITAGADVSRAEPAPPEVYFKGPFSVFSGLDKLKTLEVPIPFLFGFSRSDSNILGLEKLLPKSLEWLSLTDRLCYQEEWQWEWEMDYLLDVISSWFGKKEQFTPRLRGIRFVLEVMRVRDFVPDIIQKFRDVELQAAQVDMKFEILERPQRNASGFCH